MSKGQLKTNLVGSKQDSRKNPDNINERLQEVKSRDKNKVPFRIDSRTVIFVHPEQCTEKYRQSFIKKLKSN